MDNIRAFRMIEGRLSASVMRFHEYDVSDTDSDAFYYASKDKLELARAALERAPKLEVTTLARSLGDVYSAIKRNMAEDRRFEWDRLSEELDQLFDKYEI